MVVLILESQAIAADEVLLAPGLDKAPLDGPGASSSELHALEPPRPAPAAFTVTTATLAPAGEAALQVRDEQIRLDSHAILTWNEMFQIRSDFQVPFPSYETSIRTLQLGETHAPKTDRAEDPFLARDLTSGPEASWFDEHIELTFDHGVAYRQNFNWQGMNLRLKVWGPVLKGDPGLGMRLRGLRLGGHGVEVRARATTNLQDVQVQIDF